MSDNYSAAEMMLSTGISTHFILGCCSSRLSAQWQRMRGHGKLFNNYTIFKILKIRISGISQLCNILQVRIASGLHSRSVRSTILLCCDVQHHHRLLFRLWYLLFTLAFFRHMLAIEANVNVFFQKSTQ